MRVLLGAAAATATAEVVSGLAPGMRSFVTVVVAAAMGAVVIDTAMGAVLQLRANPALRGRVAALSGLVGAAGGAVGAPLLGGIADALGARASLVIGGTVTLVALVAAAAVLRRPRAHGRGRVPGATVTGQLDPRFRGRVGGPLPRSCVLARERG